MSEFRSVFSTEIENHIAIRKAVYRPNTVLGTIRVLKEFDSYLCEADLHVKELTEDAVETWISGLKGKTHTIGGKISQIRLFSNYLLSSGIKAYIPSPYKVRDEYSPYIFSEYEIMMIFMEADNLTPAPNQTNPWLQLEFPVIVRLLYSCGLRLGETITMRVRDIDSDSASLKLERTKNQKQRFVPMSDSMFKILHHYCDVMGILGEKDAFVFPGKNLDVSISDKSVRLQFNNILRKLGIVVHGRAIQERGPCLHCFRHTFAFKSFAQAEAMGVSLNSSVPFLSTYLGHKSLNETEKYLKFSSIMYPETVKAFERYVGGVFPVEESYEE